MESKIGLIPQPILLAQDRTFRPDRWKYSPKGENILYLGTLWSFQGKHFAPILAFLWKTGLLTIAHVSSHSPFWACFDICSRFFGDQALATQSATLGSGGTTYCQRHHHRPHRGEGLRECHRMDPSRRRYTVLVPYSLISRILYFWAFRIRYCLYGFRFFSFFQ